MSRSGYYDWLKRKPSNRDIEDQQLIERIKAIYRESRETYGSPRVHKALFREGKRVGKKRVERLMQIHGIQGRVVKVTRKNPRLKQSLSHGKNLRLYHSQATGMNQQWVADLTYLKVKSRWYYLAVVMDVYSRRIIGWSLDKTRTTALTLSALRYALKRRSCGKGLIFHTDRGIEYSTHRFRDELKRRGIDASYNRAGICTDNAHMESFFHSMKAELIRGRTFYNEHDLRYSLSSYINQFYNHKRLHSGIGYCPPAEYEQRAC